METYPQSQDEFDALFGSEEACRTYLAALRWPEGFVCPRCGQSNAWMMKRSARYICTQCQAHISLTAGTIFHDTRHSLQEWFRAIWYITQQKSGVSALGLQRALGLGSYHTAWAWLHKLRRAMVRPGRDRLAGRVQVDEAYIGGPRPGHRGRAADGKTIVVVAVEHTGKRLGRIRLQLAENVAPATMEPVIQTMVEPGSTIETDGYGSYAGLSALGYQHVILRADAKLGEEPLPQVHLVVSLLKRWLMGTHHGAVRPTHLVYYLDEFTFRFNRRTSGNRGKLFYRLVEQAVMVEPVREIDLKAKPSK
jgi:transposase-like protein